MPLDALTYAPADLDPNALYRARREAAAALWRGVPEGEFHISRWECGTAACALGWLARLGHDGWARGRRTWYGCVPERLGTEGLFAARAYFGLTFVDALFCFTANNPHGTRATPITVAAHLLSLPYPTPASVGTADGEGG